MYSQMYAFDVVPERREDFRELSLRHMAECLRDEPGTLRFLALQDDANQNRFYAIESYTDRDALDAHSNGAILARNFPLFSPMLAAPPILLGRGVDLEPSADVPTQGASGA